MKNDDKAILAGAGAVLAYLYLQEQGNKEKKNGYLRSVYISY